MAPMPAAYDPQPLTGAARATRAALPRSRSSTAPAGPAFALLLGVLCAVFPPASAMRVPLERRDTPGHTSATTIWVPIVVVILVLLIGGVLVYVYRAARVTPTATDGTPVREVTAIQLAGVTAAPNAPSRQAPRRTRRTPSQISTRSLPAYNKEAGAEELVVYQAQEGANVVMLPVPEGDSPRPSADIGSRDHGSGSASGSGSEGGDHETPLLPEETTMSPPRPSATLEHMRDVRGPAPAYFEVVLNDDDDNNDGNDEPEPQSPPANSLRGLRAFFSRRDSVPGVPPLPTAFQGHARTGSALSIGSSAEGRPASPPPRRGTHRASQSSSSLLHRMRSSGSLRAPLTSPSLLSVASISAPLTHTLVRAEFAYPAGGPTPEQVRLISSRESLGRFGVPYGPDAVAFASASRLSLAGLPSGPPPEFELRHARGDSAGSSAEAGQESSVEVVTAPSSPPAPARPSVDGLPPVSASAAPPSAFRPAPAGDPPSRRVSLASTSGASFATAAESLAPGVDVEPATPRRSLDSGPRTPTLRTHALEPTDATVRAAA